MKNILKNYRYTEGVTQTTETPIVMNIYRSKENFELECGSILPELDIAYHTYGRLNTAKDNVLWVCHALTGSSDAADWWSGLIGNEQFFDPSEWFVVCANMIGSAYGSTSPLSINPKTGKPYGRDFPVITVKDIAKSLELLANHLNINKIKCAIGGSMGGQQVLEWAIQQPDRFEDIILIACGARQSAWGVALNEAQRMAIEADPSVSAEALANATDISDYERAGAKGLEAARAIGMLSYRTYEGYNLTQNDTDETKLSDFKSASYQRYQGYKLRSRFNALSYISLSKTMDSHNVGRNRGGIAEALKKVKARTLVVGIQSDLLFPIEEQVQVAAHIKNAKLEIINSRYGHDGFLIEFSQLEKQLTRFFSNVKEKV